MSSGKIKDQNKKIAIQNMIEDLDQRLYDLDRGIISGSNERKENTNSPPPEGPMDNLYMGNNP